MTPHRWKYSETEGAAAAASTVIEGNINYVETDFELWIKNKFLMVRYLSGKESVCKKVRLLKVSNIEKDIFPVIKKFDPSAIVTAMSFAKFYITSGEFHIEVRIDSNSVFLIMTGNTSFLEDIYTALEESFEVIVTSIDWVTSTDMNMTTIPMITPKGITDFSYPFIKEGVHEYVHNYLKSSESILILIGPPGTGKSNFIKYIIAESEKNAIVTYDPKIMRSDSMFAAYVEGGYGSLIMEDADAFLAARLDGNDMMSKLLNVSDGIVSMVGKKIIFSTNLENMDEVDHALLRPGRCFGVLQFREMTYDESVAFLKHHELNSWEPEKNKTYTLASLYNNSNRDRKVEEKRKVGFI